MSVDSIVLFVIFALILVTALLVAWKIRFQIIGFTVLVSSVYLLMTADVFLVVRVPTICIAGIGVLLAVFFFVPRPAPRRREIRSDSF